MLFRRKITNKSRSTFVACLLFWPNLKKQNKNIHPETQQQQNPKHSKFIKALNLPPLKPCD